MSELPAGTVFAGHRIEAVVGRGGMGVVYRATQLDLDRTVALKVVAPELLDEERARERFLQESRLAAAIDHPHVIPLYYAGEENGIPYLAMRFVAGDDGRALVRREGPIEPQRAARIVAQVAGALDAAHAAGLVHRDVKPANVLLGPNDHAYLSDFGLSRRVRSISGVTATGQWVGTLDYVAPEQIRGGSVDARTDVYALGCVLFFLLTGVIPFPREGDEAKLWAHLTEPPPVPSEHGAPPAFDPVVQRALAKSPDDRYQSAGDLGRAAEAAAAGREVEEPERAVATGDAAPAEMPTRPSPLASEAPTRRPRPRRRIAAIATALTAAAVAVIAAVVLTGDDGGADTAARGTPTPTATAAPQEDPRVVATVPFGSRPNTVVPAEGRVWVGAWLTDQIAAIDTETNRAARARPDTGGGTVDMVVADGSLWVLSRAPQLLRLDPRSGRQQAAPVPLTMDPAALAVHGNDVYVGGELLGTQLSQVVRIDKETGAVEATVDTGPNIGGLAYVRGNLWVLHGGPNHMARRDPQTLRKTKDVLLPGATVGALAWGAGALWVTIPDQDQLVRYRPRTGDRAAVSVSPRPIGLAVLGRRVWVAASGSSTLERVSTGGLQRVGDPIRVPLNPLAVAVSAAEGVWVTCVGENVVARVGV
ncbi:MAG TPA: protein kinase [Solirubrobacteraceae bacterium]|nr:protein kinase [Solirubrobacteraceae bacterium]